MPKFFRRYFFGFKSWTFVYFYPKDPISYTVISLCMTSCDLKRK